MAALGYAMDNNSPLSPRGPPAPPYPSNEVSWGSGWDVPPTAWGVEDLPTAEEDDEITRLISGDCDDFPAPPPPRRSVHSPGADAVIQELLDRVKKNEAQIQDLRSDFQALLDTLGETGAMQRESFEIRLHRQKWS